MSQKVLRPSSSAAFRVFGGGHRAAVKDRGAVQQDRVPRDRRPGNQINREPVTAFRSDGGDTNGQGETSYTYSPGPTVAGWFPPDATGQQGNS